MLLETALGAARLIRSGQLTASELLERQFDWVDRHNGSLNAIIWQHRAGARQLAAQLDQEARQGHFRGPLHGLPITVKEAFDLVGSPSTWGLPEWRNNFPTTDSDVVARYRAAGAIVFGKTNVPMKLYEWQSFNDIYGTTNNPWDVTRTPGGSSGGSAAALAAGLSMLEAGSDIGSSIRNPAHYCGVYGLKPSWGLVPMQGHLPVGSLADIDIAVTGPMARSAADLQLAFEVLAGADRFRAPAWQTDCPADSRTELSQFKVAVKVGDAQSLIDDRYRDEIILFAEQLARAGAAVSFDDAPTLDSAAHFQLYLRLLGAAMSAGMTESAIEQLRDSVLALADPTVEQIMLPRLHGAAIRHADWLLLNNQRHSARLAFDGFFQAWDILLTPVCASAAFEHDHQGLRHQRKLQINGRQQAEMLQLFWAGYPGVVGLPAVVGPMSSVAGLPVGYQAIAGFGRDQSALAFAAAVEREIVGFSAPPGYR